MIRRFLPIKCPLCVCVVCMLAESRRTCRGCHAEPMGGILGRERMTRGPGPGLSVVVEVVGATVQL